MSLYNSQSSNILKTWTLMGVFLCLIIGIGWFYSQVYADSSILYISVAIAFFLNIFSYWFSDKIALKISGAKAISKSDAPDIYNITENLCIAAGLPLPKIYLINDQSPNAFATGRDPKHSAIAVTSGLVSILDRAELEGVIAHELSHIKNRDTLISTIVVVLVGFISILADIFLRTSFFRSEGDREGGGQVKLILGIIGIVLSILSPIVATIIQLAISRRREFLADATGALMTRYPEGLAGALKKIENYGVGVKKASNATAHLYFANPFGRTQNLKSRISGLFMTHPPTEQRIQALLSKE